jgi:hypothetical protein
LRAEDINRFLSAIDTEYAVILDTRKTPALIDARVGELATPTGNAESDNEAAEYPRQRHFGQRARAATDGNDGVGMGDYEVARVAEPGGNRHINEGVGGFRFVPGQDADGIAELIPLTVAGAATSCFHDPAEPASHDAKSRVDEQRSQRLGEPIASGSRRDIAVANNRD